MEKVSYIQEIQFEFTVPFQSKMGRNLVYPKVDKNTVHRKGDRGKLF